MSMHEQTAESDRTEHGAEASGDGEFRQIGNSMPRTDAREKLTGETIYTMDAYPEDVLHAKLVTSEHAHARLVEVDTAGAEAMDGVVAVSTAADAPDTRIGEFVFDEPIFAHDKVRYVGEPIAIVAAESERVADAAVDMVEVEYEPLEPVVDLQAAGGTDPPVVVHEKLREYGTSEEGFHLDDPDSECPNLLTTVTEETGDLETAFEDADLIVEDEYEVNPLQHCSMEAHVAVGHVDGNSATVRTSHQMPHVIKDELSRLFPSFESDDIVVNTPYAGGAFGGKETPIVEPRLLTVARRMDRPVRLALSRHQQYTTSPSRPEFRVRLKDGVTENGDLVARDITIDISVGGYDVEAFNIATALSVSVLGSYDASAVRRTTRAIYTNRPPYGAFRGFGLAEVNFAAERHMDRVADALDIDPLEYRAQNLLRAGDRNVNGDSLHPCQNEAVLRASIDSLDDVAVDTEYPEYATDEWAIGVGHAYGNKSVPQGETNVRIDLAPSGELTVRIGAPDVGQGSNTAITQMVAEEFDTPVEHVTIIAGDTDETERDMQGPSGSRFTPFTGNALRKAAETLRAELTSIASTMSGLSSDPASLRLGHGSVIGDESGVSVSLQTLIEHGKADDSPLFDGDVFSVVGRYEYTDEEHIYWVPVSQAVLVACNTLTGKIEVLRVSTAADVGTAINPKAVEQQLEGGAGQGIGGAVFEEIVYDGGRVVNGNFKQYRVPKATDLPYDSETIIFESFDTEGPFGAKSVGEVGVFPTAPAIAAAVEDALSIEFAVLPMTPERVMERLTDDHPT